MNNRSGNSFVFRFFLRFFAVIGFMFVILFVFGLIQSPDNLANRQKTYPEKQAPRALPPNAATVDGNLETAEPAPEPLPLEAAVELDIRQAFIKFNAATIGKISADVQDGTVLLHGSINNIDNSLEAERIATILSRGLPVENNILVKDIDPKWAN